VFERIGADAVTVNAYLGRDGVAPFLAYRDRHSFLLVRTSNPGARDLQDLEVGNGRRLYEHMAVLAQEWNAEANNVGMVVGATYPTEAARIRQLAPDLPILAPGVGAQSAEIEAAVRASLDPRGRGLIVNASRAVLYADRGPGYAEAARGAAIALRDQINAAREAALASV
jgi:orotidine-5'-phosphate decarboxylase